MLTEPIEQLDISFEEAVAKVLCKVPSYAYSEKKEKNQRKSRLRRVISTVFCLMQLL